MSIILHDSLFIVEIENQFVSQRRLFVVAVGHELLVVDEFEKCWVFKGQLLSLFMGSDLFILAFDVLFVFAEKRG